MGLDLTIELDVSNDALEGSEFYAGNSGWFICRWLQEQCEDTDTITHTKAGILKTVCESVLADPDSAATYLVVPVDGGKCEMDSLVLDSIKALLAILERYFEYYEIALKQPEYYLKLYGIAAPRLSWRASW